MWIQSLEDFIKNSRDQLEITRAIAVKMVLCGYKHQEIMPILRVSSGFISKWNKAFFQDGVEGLKLAYKGSKGFLDTQQRAEIIGWLRSKDRWTFNELEYQIASKYGITFEPIKINPINSGLTHSPRFSKRWDCFLASQ